MSRSARAAGAHTAIERIVGRASGGEPASPGDIVVCNVDRVVLIDMQFREFNGWRRPVRIADPDRVAVILDHAVPAPSVADANAASEARAFAREFGIERFVDVGDHGICHQVICERGWALPGEMLVCADSHTCAAGAFGTAARGLGPIEVLQVLCTGRTWIVVPETVRIEIHGSLRPVVSGKDVFLHIAARYGAVTENRALEFVGGGIQALPLHDRRTLATQAAELFADYVIFPCDDVVAGALSSAGVRGDVLGRWAAIAGDDDAPHAVEIDLHLDDVEPMVALPDRVVDNAVPVGVALGTAVHQCFIGSCANGQLEDLAIAASVLRGRRVAPGVRMIVTPGSQRVYADAVRLGYVEALVDAGAVVTSSACGACFGYDFGVLGDGEVCLTASTRNFRGRMGSTTAAIYMASPATVAASAIAGVVSDPRELEGVH
jgi:3-isopropylmalate/(R)-2-methylmalate dehydratase large subunit